MKLSSFRYLVRQGFDNVWKNRVMAFASFCVLLVSLLLVGISILFYININSIIGGIEDQNEAVIYMMDNATPERVAEVGDTLRLMDNVSEVIFVSRDQALTDLQNNTKEPELFQSLSDDNPLPDSYRIKVKDISKMEQTISSAEKIPDVLYARSPDTFVKLLLEIRRIVTIVAIAIIIALLIVSTVIISNTTRASVFSRRREI
ncbi:MAG: permease-like cell division protein FtsX, partial [Oscillospiraceae bacterium]|nr:permease-like cell division protein FtsX [Oscillospiraceae bacterium]